MKHKRFNRLVATIFDEYGIELSFRVMTLHRRHVGMVDGTFIFPNGSDARPVAIPKGVWFNKDYVAMFNEAAAVNVIKHEIAHVLTMPHPVDVNIHGKVWQDKCYELGIVPYRRFRKENFGL